MKKICRAIAALSTAGLALQAGAQESGPTVTISGFGTAALTSSDTDDAEFARPNQAAGVKKNWRTGVDSNFGIQATVKVNDWLSFTGQGLARKDAVDDWGAEAAWAFAKFKATDELSVRVGRMGAPIYMISDFRNVGYANTMLRPPAEVYRQVTLDSFDGADLLYQHSFGDTSLSVQFGAGRANKDLVTGSIEFRDMLMLHVVAENGPFTLRFGRAQAKFTLKDNPGLNTLVGTLRKVGLAPVADMMPLDDVKGTFTSVGGTMDWKNIVLQAEYAQRRTDTLVVHDTNSWYAMAGYRFGKFLPYYYHGNITQKSPRVVAGLPSTGPLAPLAFLINGRGGAAQAALQSADAIGVRWDFYKSLALKVQVDHIKPKDGPGAFLNPTPTFTGPVNVYAVALDFVF
ncbi:porin [Pseudoduganella eburnea]|uniref:Porin n=1 Tax=Massilia eburnea TaxID=1776165 RepID=A0A6L6QQM5_9BURK|nr:porin [Massilia eburnea]MTW14401.1 porin [Massilia eburnea]